MNLRRFLAEAGTLVGLAVACALVSNALASKERKLAIPGDYPNATKVTARPEARPLAAFEAEPLTGAPGGPEAGARRACLPSAGTAAPAALPTPVPTASPTVGPVPRRKPKPRPAGRAGPVADGTVRLRRPSRQVPRARPALRRDHG